MTDSLHGASHGEVVAARFEKINTTHERLNDLATALRRSARAMEVLAETPPGDDPAQVHAEAVRLASQAVTDSTVSREHLMMLAAQEPDRVPLAKIARLTNLSVNTVRSRTGRGGRPPVRADEPGPGF